MIENLNRRRFMTGAATAAASVAVPVTMSGTASALSIGSSVYTTANLNVRTGPGLENGVIATAEKYTGMYIKDGPWDEDGYRWWRVRVCGDANNGNFEGYSVEKFMDSADISFPVTGVITSPYGSRGSGFHGAVDIANSTGTPIYAARAGTATTLYEASGCGNYVVIDHGAGYQTLYCHMSGFTVADGDYVGRYEQIGTIGSTGNASGPHVHFEVNRYGNEQFVTGDDGEETTAFAGMPKNYDGL
jgi:murein DD-endopeptidase MepM/ murein hydrolase activator NlpD